MSVNIVIISVLIKSIAMSQPTYIECPQDFSKENYHQIGYLQAESLRYGEEFHYYKGSEYADQMKAVLESDRLVEGSRLFFEQNGLLFVAVRGSYLSIMLYIYKRN